MHVSFLFSGLYIKNFKKAVLLCIEPCQLKLGTVSSRYHQYAQVLVNTVLSKIGNAYSWIWHFLSSTEQKFFIRVGESNVLSFYLYNWNNSSFIVYIHWFILYFFPINFHLWLTKWNDLYLVKLIGLSLVLKVFVIFLILLDVMITLIVTFEIVNIYPKPKVI